MIANVYLLNKRASKFTKQRLEELSGVPDKSSAPAEIQRTPYSREESTKVTVQTEMRALSINLLQAVPSEQDTHCLYNTFSFQGRV